MNLFRSEEHVNSWSYYDPTSDEAIMPLENWAEVFAGPMFRNRLDPDYLARIGENWAAFYGTLAKFGKVGGFWAV